MASQRETPLKASCAIMRMEGVHKRNGVSDDGIAFPNLPLCDDIGWPIALRKGIRSTRNPHPIYLSYHRLSPSYFSFVSSVSSITIPKSVCEALNHPGWRQAMIVEMQALEQSGTWELVPLPSGKKAVGCRW
ncbi:putative mitochondrial protein, partial [Mucuna pruriens]